MELTAERDERGALSLPVDHPAPVSAPFEFVQPLSRMGAVCRPLHRAFVFNL